jgi:tryptophanyl-tRNA synthetase
MGNNMSKPVILTGLRANNDLHIGNYFGALLPLIDMAKNRSDEFEVNLFVPDLHSFTTPIDHGQLHDQIMHNLKLYVAAGLPLDNDSVHIYRQSYVPAHSELTWILDNFTGFGEMSRMTQFKDKSAKLMATREGDIQPDTLTDAIQEAGRKQDRISVGLFNYPVLMAADILLYGASYVPVGDDQSQHLEFARDIAERLNGRFGELFTVPKPVKEQHEFFGKDQGLRIKDLQDPTKKMSKSDENGKGVIFLGDDPVVAAKKIRSATTDSFGRIEAANKEQAGIKNLLQLIALVTGNDLQEVSDSYEGQEQYGPLKDDAAIGIGNFLGEFQERFAAVDEAQLMAKLQADEAQMNQIANTTLLKVQKAVGLRA